MGEAGREGRKGMWGGDRGVEIARETKGRGGGEGDRP